MLLLSILLKIMLREKTGRQGEKVPGTTLGFCDWYIYIYIYVYISHEIQGLFQAPLLPSYPVFPRGKILNKIESNSIILSKIESNSIILSHLPSHLFLSLIIVVVLLPVLLCSFTFFILVHISSTDKFFQSILLYTRLWQIYTYNFEQNRE